MQIPNDLKWTLCQRDPVFLPGLGPRTRNCPNAEVQVKFIPGSAAHFRGSGCGIDKKFECLCSYPVSFPKLKDEVSNFLVGHSWVVPNTVDSGFCREKVIEMPSPLGRVLPLPIATDSRPVQNSLNSAPQPSSGLGFKSPDWAHDLHHDRGINVRY